MSRFVWSCHLLLPVLLGCAAAQSSTAPPPDLPPLRGEAPAARLPDADAYRELEPGVFVREVVLENDNGSSRVWLYVPGLELASPIGCVVVPPAGSNLISGATVGEGGRPEHIPYVKAGYAVVSFDIAGPLRKGATDAELIRAMAEFRQAHAGIDNARAALDTAFAALPSIDPDRVFAAGHSSAGSLALLFAADDARVRAVAAFAPVVDIHTWHPAAVRAQLDNELPGFDEFLRVSSPVTHASTLARKPVFLFHALDDTVVDPKDTERLFDLMKDRHPASRRVTVPTGDHYHAMIRDGIPKTIDWFHTLSRH